MPGSPYQHVPENPLIAEEVAHTITIRDMRRTHWFWMDNKALQYIPQIGPRAFVVYAVLCRLAGDQGHAWPTRRSLQSITGMGWNSVRQAIQKLEKYGFVKTVQRRGQSNKFSSNEYILLEVQEKSQDAQIPLHGNGAPENGATVSRCTETVHRLIPEVKKKDPPPIVPPHGGNQTHMFSTPEVPGQKTSAKIPSLQAQEVLTYLNTASGRRYKNPGLIQACLTNGATVEDCKTVIDFLHTVRRQEDPQWVEKYLDPSTPFRPANFDKYLARATALQNVPVPHWSDSAL